MVFIKRINGVVVEDKDLSNITLSNKVITEIIRVEILITVYSLGQRCVDATPKNTFNMYITFKRAFCCASERHKVLYFFKKGKYHGETNDTTKDKR